MPSPIDLSATSRYLARLFSACPSLSALAQERIEEPLTADELRGVLADRRLDENTLKPALRELKRYAYARIASRDLSGRAPLGEVVTAMTEVAEQAIVAAQAVLTAALAERYGLPRDAGGRVQELIVIGMGKLGGRELNVSSDIDLIFVYPEDGETDGARRISNFEFFTRLGRQLINAIADVTGDGQVFRVDMRLRPNGDSGPLVCSFEMLENYFFSQGREWERYAWIKARPLTGACHEGLEAIRQPFVFRRYLDFGAIQAMRELHAQIRCEVAKKSMADNVKLGPGGIREIEFLAQVFQLIRGGRDPGLQQRPTLTVLSALAERGLISAGTRNRLAEAYDFLRRVEHRLQYLDDAQTHQLPVNEDDRQIIARTMGFADHAGFMAALDVHRAFVSTQFEQIFAEREGEPHPLTALWQGIPEDPAAVVAAGDQLFSPLTALGYRDPQAACLRLAELRGSARYRGLAESGRQRLDVLVPRLIELAACQAQPDAVLARGLDLLAAIGRRGAYLALLQENPAALERVTQLAGSSRWAATYLQRHPILLDELLDPRLLESMYDWADFRAQLQARLDALEPDAERQMDVLREQHHAQEFRLLAQDVAGRLTVERLSDHLSALADTVLEVTLPCVWRKLPRRTGEQPRFAIVGYGKLGGKELGYASDLDLVFLYDDPDEAAGEIYGRFATRLNTWFSAQTPAGQLFEVDLRLRPNGDSGLVATSLEAFRRYQFEAAWTWEHQALTRARFCAGDAAVGQRFEAIRVDVLRQERELGKLAAEVVAMRQKMYDAHATPAGKRDTTFDLKHDPGGLIDVEFIVQYLVLGHACRHESLTANLGNIALLGMAAELGLLPASLASRTADAYRELRRRQHALRLNEVKARVAPDEVAREAATVRELWHHVFPS